MADYYTPAQLALKIGISEAQIAELKPEERKAIRFLTRSSRPTGGPETRPETES